MRKNKKKTESVQELNQNIQRKETGVKQYQMFILRVLILLVIVWLLFFVFIGLTRMPSGDMYPRMDAGDMVMYYRLDRNPVAQDVIVYEITNKDGYREQLISRVIACPGDTVDIEENGSVRINGHNVTEMNVFYYTSQFEGDAVPQFPVKLGEDEYFVMGDRRDQAYDSRVFGPVKQSEIIGTVITILRRNAI